MDFDNFERGYLLPKGCKDLIPPQPSQPVALKHDLLVPDHITVKELAALLRQKPFKLILDLMELGVFPNVSHGLDFEVVSQIACKYGYVAKRPA